MRLDRSRSESTPSSSGRLGARVMVVLIERYVLISRAATPDCFSRSVPHLRTDRANNTQMSGRATVVGEEASARAGRPWAVDGRVLDRASHRAHRMRALESMRPRSFFTARTGLLDVCARALCKQTFASTISGVAFGGEGGREFEAAGAHRRPVRSKGIGDHGRLEEGCIAQAHDHERANGGGAAPSFVRNLSQTCELAKGLPVVKRSRQPRCAYML